MKKWLLIALTVALSGCGQDSTIEPVQSPELAVVTSCGGMSVYEDSVFINVFGDACDAVTVRWKVYQAMADTTQLTHGSIYTDDPAYPDCYPAAQHTLFSTYAATVSRVGPDYWLEYVGPLSALSPPGGGAFEVKLSFSYYCASEQSWQNEIWSQTCFPIDPGQCTPAGGGGHGGSGGGGKEPPPTEG